MKKLVVALLVGAIWFGSGMQTDAAGLRDVFDAKYYAEQYEDLEKAFGNDAEALYQHFVNYGVKEGRNMNPIIDIAKYRQQYDDLNKAFGDNWDAYVEHYFKYGVKEDRNNGTNFDVKKYKNAYKDIQDAFGDDYEKIAKHYLKHGKEEKRDKGNKEHIAKPGKKPHVQPPVSLERSERSDNPDGSWSIIDYDVKGYCVKVTYYKADGSLDCYMEFINDANGVRQKELFYEASGELSTTTYIYYGANGKIDYSKNYYSDGSTCIQKYNEYEIVGETYDYNADGELIGSSIAVMENGEWVGSIYYDAEGNITMEYKRVVAEDGTITFVPVEPEEDENEETGFTGTQEDVREDGTKMVYEYVNGQIVKSSYYDAAGALIDYATYVYDENGREISYTTYDASGKMTACVENKYNESNELIEAIVTSADGVVTVNQYDRVNGYHTVISHDANGNFLGHDVSKVDENMNPVECKKYDANGNLIGEYIVEKGEDNNYILIPKEV